PKHGSESAEPFTAAGSVYLLRPGCVWIARAPGHAPLPPSILLESCEHETLPFLSESLLQTIDALLVIQHHRTLRVTRHQRIADSDRLTNYGTRQFHFA